MESAPSLKCTSEVQKQHKRSGQEQSGRLQGGGDMSSILKGEQVMTRVGRKKRRVIQAWEPDAGYNSPHETVLLHKVLAIQIQDSWLVLLLSSLFIICSCISVHGKAINKSSCYFIHLLRVQDFSCFLHREHCFTKMNRKSFY